MHGRKPDAITSREIGMRDALVMAPLAACIVGLALYPGLILGRSDAAVKDKIAATSPQPITSAATGGFLPLCGGNAPLGAPYPACGGAGTRGVRRSR
jgi:hypothetical protein